MPEGGKFAYGLRGFPTPNGVPDDIGYIVFRFPNSNDFAGLLLGAAQELANEWNYYQWGECLPEQAAEIWKEIVQEAPYNFCSYSQPGGAPVTRLTPLGSWEVLDGEWVPPSGDYAIPAYTARTEPTTEERKCLAAKNAAYVLSQIYEEISDQAGEIIDIEEKLLNVAAFIGGIIIAPIGLLAAAGLALVLSSLEFTFAIAEVVTEDVWTSDFDNALICILLENATDDGGVITFDFAAVRSGVLEMGEVFDLTFRAFQLSAQVNFMLNTIGAEGLNFAGETTEIEDPDCEFCEDTWCYLWTLGDSMGNWAIYPGQPGSVGAGGVETGLVFVGDDPARGRVQTIVQFLGFPEDATVTSITAGVNMTNGSTADLTGNGIAVNDFDHFLALTGALPDGDTTIGWGGSDGGIDSVEIVMSAGGCDTCGDPGGVGIMPTIMLTGTGTLPVEFFGGEDCS